jgi:hypothetical protein
MGGWEVEMGSWSGPIWVDESGALYHVKIRGNEKNENFVDDED